MVPLAQFGPQTHAYTYEPAASEWHPSAGSSSGQPFVSVDMQGNNSISSGGDGNDSDSESGSDSSSLCEVQVPEHRPLLLSVDGNDSTSASLICSDKALATWTPMTPETATSLLAGQQQAAANKLHRHRRDAISLPMSSPMRPDPAEPDTYWNHPNLFRCPPRQSAQQQQPELGPLNETKDSAASDGHRREPNFESELALLWPTATTSYPAYLPISAFPTAEQGDDGTGASSTLAPASLRILAPFYDPSTSTHASTNIPSDMDVEASGTQHEHMDNSAQGTAPTLPPGLPLFDFDFDLDTDIGVDLAGEDLRMRRDTYTRLLMDVARGAAPETHPETESQAPVPQSVLPQLGLLSCSTPTGRRLSLLCAVSTESPQSGSDKKDSPRSRGVKERRGAGAKRKTSPRSTLSSPYPHASVSSVPSSSRSSPTRLRSAPLTRAASSFLALNEPSSSLRGGCDMAADAASVPILLKLSPEQLTSKTLPKLKSPTRNLAYQARVRAQRTALRELVLELRSVIGQDRAQASPGSLDAWAAGADVGPHTGIEVWLSLRAPSLSPAGSTSSASSMTFSSAAAGGALPASPEERRKRKNAYKQRLRSEELASLRFLRALARAVESPAAAESAGPGAVTVEQQETGRLHLGSLPAASTFPTLDKRKIRNTVKRHGAQMDMVLAAEKRIFGGMQVQAQGRGSTTPRTEKDSFGAAEGLGDSQKSQVEDDAVLSRFWEWCCRDS